MTLTEHGDLMLDGLDEYGRLRIDSLLEDGTKIIVVEAPPAGQPYISRVQGVNGMKTWVR